MHTLYNTCALCLFAIDNMFAKRSLPITSNLCRIKNPTLKLNCYPRRRGFSACNSRYSAQEDSTSRLRRLNDRLPRFLRPYTAPLLGAPVTHVSSFLILHEITAVVPLFGLVVAFHYYGDYCLPDSSWFGGEGGAFDEGVKRFGRWLCKKGWIDDVDVHLAGEEQDRDAAVAERFEQEGRKGFRLVIEFASAYAITKALLPVRIAASVLATPWFARTILRPLGAGFNKRLFRSKE